MLAVPTPIVGFAGLGKAAHLVERVESEVFGLDEAEFTGESVDLVRRKGAEVRQVEVDAVEMQAGLFRLVSEDMLFERVVAELSYGGPIVVVEPVSQGSFRGVDCCERLADPGMAPFSMGGQGMLGSNDELGRRQGRNENEAAVGLDGEMKGAMSMFIDVLPLQSHLFSIIQNRK